MAAVVRPTVITAAPTRPALRVIEGGRTRSAAPARPLDLRAVALVVALLVAAVGAVAIGRGALAALAPAPPATAAAGAATAGPVVEVAVAEAGDTLWSIARDLQPSGDIRPLVDQLAAANPGVLQPGQSVVLPR